MKKRGTWMLFLVLLIVACQESRFISADVFFKRMPVVAALISPSEDFRCYLHWTEDAATGLQDTIKNAVLSLYENDMLLGALEYRSERIGMGWYTRELGYYDLPGFVAKVGAQYRLVVDIPDYGTLEASTTVPRPVPILSVVPGLLHQSKPGEYFEEFYIDVHTVTLDKKFDTTEYFLLGGDFGSREAAFLSLTDARYRGAVPFHFSQNQFLFDDRFMLPGAATFEISTSRFSDGAYQPGTEAVADVVLLNLHRDLYTYFTTLTRVFPKGGVLDPLPSLSYSDPTEVYSNIKGNGVGIFSAYTKTTFPLTPVPLTNR